MITFISSYSLFQHEDIRTTMRANLSHQRP